jgi:hypothetical protein
MYLSRPSAFISAANWYKLGFIPAPLPIHSPDDSELQSVHHPLSAQFPAHSRNAVYTIAPPPPGRPDNSGATRQTEFHAVTQS